MKTIYKIFLLLFIVFLGINLYALDWQLGFLNQENTKFVFSASAAILGIILVFVLDNWSRLKVQK